MNINYDGVLCKAKELIALQLVNSNIVSHCEYIIIIACFVGHGATLLSSKPLTTRTQTLSSHTVASLESSDPHKYSDSTILL
jgi:hypothetical protein